MTIHQTICKTVMLLIAFGPTAYAQGIQQKTAGYCRPAISNTTGDVTTKCYVSVGEWRKSIIDLLEEATQEVNKLLMTQMYYLIPAMTEYISNPSERTWKAAKGSIDMVNRRLLITVDAVIEFDGSLEKRLGPNLLKLHNTLRSRGGLLSELPNNPPPREFVDEWITRYRIQMDHLDDELRSMKELVQNSKKTQ